MSTTTTVEALFRDYFGDSLRRALEDSRSFQSTISAYTTPVTWPWSSAITLPRFPHENASEWPPAREPGEAFTPPAERSPIAQKFDAEMDVALTEWCDFHLVKSVEIRDHRTNQVAMEGWFEEL